MTQHVHVHSEEPDFLAACYQRIRAAVHEQCRCRECGDYCTLTATLCETCGTQDPVRLPISWAIAAVAVGTMVIAIGMWVL